MGREWRSTFRDRVRSRLFADPSRGPHSARSGRERVQHHVRTLPIKKVIGSYKKRWRSAPGAILDCPCLAAVRRMTHGGLWTVRFSLCGAQEVVAQPGYGSLHCWKILAESGGFNERRAEIPFEQTAAGGC